MTEQQKPTQGTAANPAGKLEGQLAANFASLSLEDQKKAVVEALEKHHKEEAQKKLAALPPSIRRRVQALRKLNNEVSELEKAYDRERIELLKKYDALRKPIYDKRTTIVKGEYEPKDEELLKEDPPKPAEGEKKDEPKAAEPKPAEPKETNAKGIPGFWKEAINNYEYLLDLLSNGPTSISERDQEALDFLVDIRCTRQDDKGFVLEFEFAENPFFTNKVLTKTYHMTEDMGGDDLLLDHADGTKIEWKAGKNLTVEMKTKKQRRKGRGGANAVRTVTREEPCDSFFRFFEPPSLGEVEDDEEGDMIENLMEADYEIGVIIRDKLLPKAVEYYTGEAVSLSYDPEYEEGDEDDDDEPEGDDEDDEEEEPVVVPRGRGGGRGGAAPAAPAAGKGAPKQPPPQDCKQQ
jgi:nucleosome assembly protein 1-like 1